MSIKPGKYTHFKGNKYEVIGTTIHSETLEEMILYRPQDGDGTLWVRPTSMWDELVEHKGTLVKRFVADPKY